MLHKVTKIEVHELGWKCVAQPALKLYFNLHRLHYM